MKNYLENSTTYPDDFSRTDHEMLDLLQMKLKVINSSVTLALYKSCNYFSKQKMLKSGG